MGRLEQATERGKPAILRGGGAKTGIQQLEETSSGLQLSKKQKNKQTKRGIEHSFVLREIHVVREERYKTNKDIDTQRKATGLSTPGRRDSMLSDCTAMGLTF